MNISGKVVSGDRVGRKLGYPTANLDRRSFSRRKLKLKLGVYAGFAELKIKNLKLKNYQAAIIIGPIDRKGLPKIEVHLLKFKGNLYGKKLTVSLGKYIRPFKKFKSEAELKLQIAQDIKLIKILR